MGKSKGKKENKYGKDGKAASMYQSISERMLGSKLESTGVDVEDRQEGRLSASISSKRIPLQVCIQFFFKLK